MVVFFFVFFFLMVDYNDILICIVSILAAEDDGKILYFDVANFCNGFVRRNKDHNGICYWRRNGKLYYFSCFFSFFLSPCNIILKSHLIYKHGILLEFVFFLHSRCRTQDNLFLNSIMEDKYVDDGFFYLIFLKSYRWNGSRIKIFSFLRRCW